MSDMQTPPAGTSHPLSFRYAQTAKELSRASRLIKRGFASLGSDQGKPGRAAFNALLRQAVSTARIFPGYFVFICAYTGKRLSGVCVCTDAHISMLFVDKKYRRSGIGQALVAQARLYAIKLGYKKITVNSTPSAAEFYRKAGFKDMSGVLSRNGIRFIAMEGSALNE